MIVMALGQLSTENIILRIVLTSMLEFLSFCTCLNRLIK